MKIETSRINHGLHPGIICTVEAKHEIAFSPSDILTVLREMASDDMAKIFNWMGAEWNKWQMTQAYAVDDLDEHGRELVDNLHYFLHCNDNKEP